MSRPFIVIDRRWSLVLALVAGAAFGTAVAVQMQRKRRSHRRADEREARTDIHAWEGEGGSLAPAADPAMEPERTDRGRRSSVPRASR